MMVTHLETYPTDVSEEATVTRGAHARFFIKKSFIKNSCSEMWMSKVMIRRLNTIELVH